MRVIDVVRKYCGGLSVRRADYICGDLGIAGGDVVELLEELESTFGVDLRPLVERGPVERNSFWHRLCGVEPRQSGVDVRVEEIASFITSSSEE